MRLDEHFRRFGLCDWGFYQFKIVIRTDLEITSAGVVILIHSAHTLVSSYWRVEEGIDMIV